MPGVGAETCEKEEAGPSNRDIMRLLMTMNKELNKKLECLNGTFERLQSEVFYLKQETTGLSAEVDRCTIRRRTCRVRSRKLTHIMPYRAAFSLKIITHQWEQHLHYPQTFHYWAVQAGLFTPFTFARHCWNPLAAFTSGAYFLHNGRRWQWICKFYTAKFKGIFGGL